MKSKKILLAIGIIPVIILWLTAALHAAPIKVTVIAASDCPVELSPIKEDTASFEFHFAVKNNGDKDIENIFLVAYAFLSDGTLKGGMAFHYTKELGKSQIENVSTNFKPIAEIKAPKTAEKTDETAPAAVSMILLIPARIDFKPEQTKDITVNNSWHLEFASLAGITPKNAATYSKSQGKVVDTNELLDKDAASCPFCAWARNYEFICGNSMFQTKCSKNPCIRGFQCDCEKVYASFICKTTDICFTSIANQCPLMYFIFTW